MNGDALVGTDSWRWSDTAMVTDIHGAIEIRDLFPAEREASWKTAIDLYPLLEDGGPCGAYPAYAYLFGVRNQYGFSPIAEARGLPIDVSPELCTALEPLADFHSMSWVSWSELLDLDLLGPFGHVVGYLAWSSADSSLEWTRLVPSVPKLDELAFAGIRLGPELELKVSSDWQHEGVNYRYRPMTVGTYFGDGTPWGHVFGVMRALARRFGDDGVRLVAAFDS